MNTINKILLIIISLSSFSSAQYRIEHLTAPESGIPLDLVYTMMQDSKGFIWFGTMYGLVRYDGREYVTFRHDPDELNSISFDDVISLHEDKNGLIWIGTWGGGLNRYNPVDHTFKRFSDQSELTEKIIWDINEDLYGNIWLAVQSGGLVKYNPQQHSFTKFPGDKVNQIYFSSSGEMLLGTQTGIRKFQNNKFVQDERFSIVGKLSVSDMLIDRNNQYWIASNNGIYVFNDGVVIKHIKEELTSPLISSLISDKQGNIWAGTFSGLNKISKELTEKFYLYNSGPNSIRDLFFDESGILWVSTYNIGITMLKPGGDKFSSFTVDNIISITKDNASNLWMVNGAGKLSRYNTFTNKIDLSFNTELRINTIHFNNESIWLAGNQGLFEFHPASEKLTKINPGTFTAFLHLDSLILLGTPGRGLYQYDIFNKKLEELDLGAALSGNHFVKNILCLYKDTKENIWAGTYGGLISLSKDLSGIRLYKYDQSDNTSLSNNYVYAIYEDQANNLWIGTSNGLNRFTSSLDTFERFYEKNGLPNGVITGITGDRNSNLWITTYKGVSNFIVKDKRFINYDNSEGLLGNVFSTNGILTTKDGTIYICSRNGINFFKPSNTRLSQFQPRIVITSLTSDDHELYPKNNVFTFNPDQNSFRIKFAALDFNNPRKNQYKFTLENFDHRWINSGTEHQAVYTNLSPGKYKFRVKATNSDGVWSKNEAVIQLVVLPAFYQTWWFIVLSICIIIIAAIVLFNLRIKQKLKLAAAIENARAEESEKIRQKTAMDFHDELGHHLTRITLLAGLIKKRSVLNTDMNTLMDKIIENANSLYTGTKDFIWAIDPHNDSLYEVVVRLKDFGDELYDKTDICFEAAGLKEEFKQVNLSMDLRRNVILIFKEAMNNSLKYSSAERVVLHSDITENQIQISLEDSGKGFPGDIDHINGLSNMKRRAEKVLGKLEVFSAAEKGTTITFKSVINTKEIKFN